MTRPRFYSISSKTALLVEFSDLELSIAQIAKDVGPFLNCIEWVHHDGAANNYNTRGLRV